MFLWRRGRERARGYSRRGQALGKDRVEVFRRVLGLMPPGRLLDLATGHGTFAIAAHELGWEVVAVDVRDARMPETPGITWLRSDVRDLEIGDDFDCIAALGLLYHLELDAQLELLRRCAGTPTIVDTHVSLRPDVREGRYRGHYFDEWSGRSEDEWRSSTTASWGNRLSFWPDEPSLERMIHDAGFRDIWKLTPPYLEDRTFWLCL